MIFAAISLLIGALAYADPNPLTIVNKSEDSRSSISKAAYSARQKEWSPSQAAPMGMDALRAEQAAALPFHLWSRQNYESQKRQEVVSLLERLLGSNKAGIYLHFEWPLPQDRLESPLVPIEPARVVATIVLGRNVSENDANFLRDVAMRVLGLSIQRGDQLEIYQLAQRNQLYEILTEPQNVLDIMKFIGLIILILLVLFSISRASRQISASLERLATETRTHDIDLRLTPKAPPLGAPDLVTQSQMRLSAEAEEKIPSPQGFNPLNHVDPETLAHVLEGENPRAIALYIGTLDPEAAGKVLASLSPSKQEEVALTISQMDGEPDAREVSKLQSQIHFKLRRLLQVQA